MQIFWRGNIAKVKSTERCMAMPVRELLASGIWEKVRVRIKELGTLIAMWHCQPSMKQVDSAPRKGKRSVQILSDSYGEWHTEQAARKHAQQDYVLVCDGWENKYWCLPQEVVWKALMYNEIFLLFLFFSHPAPAWKQWKSLVPWCPCTIHKHVYMCGYEGYTHTQMVASWTFCHLLYNE